MPVHRAHLHGGDFIKWPWFHGTEIINRTRWLGEKCRFL